MRKKLLLCFIAISAVICANAQLTENFSDGDFTANPAWVGGTGDFIVNASGQLQSNNTVVNAAYYLSTASTKATSAQWDFSCNITFNPSSANYADIFLTASASDLSLTSTAGFFVRVGGTDDEVSLFRRDASGTVTKIIDGVNGILNTSNNALKIRVVRTAANLWTLSRDLNTAGLVSEGTVTDANLLTSAFFGIYIKQSTASFFQRHFIDDIQVQNYTPDVTPPAITSATAVAANAVDVLFSEPVDLTSSQVITNYVANQGVGSPATAVRDASNTALVHLVFTTNFPGATNCQLTVNGVADLSGNAISNGVATFSFTASPPVILSASALTANAADVLFNEPVELLSSQLASNYVVNNGLGSPATATRDATNFALVHLSFTTSFPNRVTLQMTVNGVKDLSGSPIANGTTAFSYFTAAQYDVVIDELIADPTPQVGLPNSEWIELKNTSGFDINLQGWRIGDATGQSGPMPSYVLKADSFVIVCTSSAVAALNVFGPVISVTSFPSLDNTSDIIFLRASGGNLIHAVNYTDAWYQNELKKDGGWTLEMIDTKNPCAGISNWKASTDAKGGTPGKKNSADAVNPDKTAPRLLRAFATDAFNIILTFDESLDSSKAATAANYSISDGIGAAVAAVAAGPLFNQVNLQLSNPLQLNKVYTLTVTTLTDCSGNAVSTNSNTTRVGLTGQIRRFDIVVNEILFNPKPDGADYVELYNRSQKIFNLKNAYLANRATNGSIGSITQLTTDNYPLFPGEFVVVTGDVAAIKRDFVAENPNAFIEVSTPSYNDDKGNVILLNEQGAVIDEIAYLDDWQFALISNDEGVALERINYDDTSLVPAQQQKNWHSAAASVNYGTPTYKNSQFRIDAGVQGDITVTPKIISPDNDGMDDFATISYSFPEPGYVASITIFDAAGRPVRYLQRNALTGVNGYYRWDGLDEKQQKLPVGLYIVYTEIFNLSGKTKKFKNTIVLARRQ